jgi:hypothetical protein
VKGELDLPAAPSAFAGGAAAAATTIELKQGVTDDVLSIKVEGGRERENRWGGGESGRAAAAARGRRTGQLL